MIIQLETCRLQFLPSQRVMRYRLNSVRRLASLCYCLSKTIFLDDNVLCIPFLYFFSFRSKIVYLSLGRISASVGISAFHRSRSLTVVPCFLSAVSIVAMTLSTMRRRLRCRAFWGAERRHGIFLHSKTVRKVAAVCKTGTEEQMLDEAEI